MVQLASFELRDGTFISAEVEDLTNPLGTVRRGVAPSDLAIKASQSFDAALDTVKQVAETMVDRLRSLATPADEATVEFGVKLSGEAGAVIAKASTEASFKISLTWKRKLTTED